MDSVDTVIPYLCSSARQGCTDWSAYGHISGRDMDNLVILNYTAMAAIENQWTAAERVCRGLIIDRKTGEVVARPFDKFFNWGEGGRTTEAPIKYVQEKLDGSLGILYRHKGDYHVATRGSFDSEQAQWATKWLHEHVYDRGMIPRELTLLVEIVYRENRVVVDYSGVEGLFLLAARNRFTGQYMSDMNELDILAIMLGLGRAERSDRAVYNIFHRPSRLAHLRTPSDLEAACATLSVADGEGWVAVFEDGQRFKFKGEEYKKLHRALSGLTPRRVFEAWADGSLDQMFELIPDEFLDDARGWVEEIEGVYRDLRRGAVEALALAGAAGCEDRKDIALFLRAHGHGDVASICFAMLDGKDVDAVVRRLVKKTWEKKGEIA